MSIPCILNRRSLMKLPISAIIVALIASIAVPLAAQSIADEDLVLAAIIQHKLDQRSTPAPIKIDPRPISIEWTTGPNPRPMGGTVRWGENRGLERMATLTGGNDVLSGTLESTVLCRPTPSGRPSCSFVGTDLFIAASRPMLVDGTARMLLEVWMPTGDTSWPVNWASFLYTLARTSNGWAISKEEILGVS